MRQVGGTTLGGLGHSANAVCNVLWSEGSARARGKEEPVRSGSDRETLKPSEQNR